MAERKLFLEIPGRKNDFHSAVLTSFSFNFHHFEFQVLRALRRKWVTSVSVLVDHAMLEGSIGLAMGNLKQLSQSYSVHGVKSIGAFHSKVNFLTGDTKLLMFFGSGNITPGGHGKNHELFTAFYADSQASKQLPILLEGWDYIQSLARDISGYNKDRIVKQIPAESELLRGRRDAKHTFHKLDGDVEVALLYNEDTSILSQLLHLVPNESIKRVTIACPYFDEDGEALVALADHFNTAEFTVYLPAEFGSPPINIKPNPRINFYAWEDTNRGQAKITGHGTYLRKLHCKLLHFESETNEYLMLGSANVSNAGLGTTNKRGANDEFGAIYKSQTIDFLKTLEVKGGTKRKLDISGLERTAFGIDEESSSKYMRQPVFITSIDLNGLSLILYLKDPPKRTDLSVMIYNSSGELLHRASFSEGLSKENSLRLPTEIATKDLAYGDLVDQVGVSVSNKQLINNLEKLFRTDPSKANRTITQIVNALETGAINEFEILSYLNDINDSKPIPTTTGHQRGGNKDEQEEEPVVEMTYDEAVEAAAKSPDQKEQLLRAHNSVQLWESISRLLFQTIQIRNDELDDEEEEGAAEAGNIRKYAEALVAPSPKQMTVSSLIEQVTKLTERYRKSLTRISNKNVHKVDVIDYIQFLLITHIVTSLTYFNDGRAFREKGWEEKLNAVFKHQIKDILSSFSKVLVRHPVQTLVDNSDAFSTEKRKEYQIKTIYHTLLYLYLIDSLTSEQFMGDRHALIAFNLFDRLGVSESAFDQYMDDISRTIDGVRFNAASAIRFKNKLEAKYAELANNANIIRLSHSGACLIKERKAGKAYYESVFGSSEMPLKKA